MSRIPTMGFRTGFAKFVTLFGFGEPLDSPKVITTPGSHIASLSTPGSNSSGITTPGSTD